MTSGGLLANTMTFGLATAAVGTVLGWLLAHVQVTYRFAGRSALHVLNLAGMLMPSFTFAMALVMLAGHGGWVSRLSGGQPFEVYGLGGLVAAGVLARLPYAYLGLLLAYRSVDQRLLDAAADLGASRARAELAVVVPRVVPALGATFVVLLADTIADVANPLVIGGGFDVLSTRLVEAVSGEGDLTTAWWCAAQLLVPAALGLLAARTNRAPAASATPLTPRRPGWAGRAAITASWLIGTLVAVLLGLVVVGVFAGTDAAPTLRHLGDVVGGRSTRALATTVLVALLTALGAGILTLALGLGASRGRRRARALLVGARIGTAVPGLVLGLTVYTALAATLQALDAGRSATLWLTLAALLAVQVLRQTPGLLWSSLRTLADAGPQAHEAALTLGGTRRAVALHVDGPRLAPALITGVTTTFARSLTAVSSVLLLASAQAPLLTARMLVEIDLGNWSAACAMTVVLGALVLGALGAGSAMERVWVRPRERRGRT